MSEEIIARYHVLRREFLNKYACMPGFIIGVVEDTRAIPDNDPEQCWNDGQINLALADCYRRVSFQFNMYDSAERAHSLRNVNSIWKCNRSLFEKYFIRGPVTKRLTRPVV